MKPRNDDSVFGLLRILVFVQMVVAVVTAVEAMLIGVLMGALGVGVATLVAAGLTVVFYIGLGRRSPRSRRWLKRFQWGWITLAALDLALAIFLAQRGLEVVPLLTRVVLPFTIWRLLRRPDIEAEFWAAPDAAQQIRDDGAHALA